MIHDPQRNDETASGQGERVAKALARAGVASRRDVEKLIEEGRVALNGKVLTTPAVKVEPGDILTVDGEVVNEAEPTRLFRYHKPVDLLTTHKDPAGRATVFDALPPGLPRLISIGRLDINSEGLLLLTNDGELARALEQPSNGIVRRYRVRARGRITQAELDKLKDGVTVEGVTYGPIDAKIDKAKDGPQGANIWITVILAEGKNREVRRVMKSIGLTVGRLIRLSYGPFALGTLEMGQVEEVGPRVIREQLAELISPENLPKGDKVQFVPRPPPPGAHAVRDGTGRRGSSARAAASGEPKPKTSYKDGWARPKVEIKHAQVKRRRAPRPGDAADAAAAVPLAPRVRSSRLVENAGGIRTYTQGEPLAPRPPGKPGAKPYAKGKPAPRPKSGGRPFDAAAPRPRTKGATLIEAGPRSNDGKPARPKSFGAPRGEGRPSGPPREGRSSGPAREDRASGPPREGRASGPGRSSGPAREGRPSGPPRGPRPTGGAPRGGASDRPKGPRPSGPKRRD